VKSSAVYHRRASRRRGDRIAGICSRRGNVISFARGKKVRRNVARPWPLSRPDRHDPRGAGLCRLHHAAIFGAAQAAGEMVDRNRKDSLQLLRIQNDLNSLGLAMRDMLDASEPYPLIAWTAHSIAPATI